MNRIVKGFLCGLVLVSLVIVPACKSKKTPAPKVVPTETTSTVPPTVPVTTTETQVSNPPDFVQTETQPKVTVTELPADVEQLNQVVQQRGYLQDAFFSFDESTLTPDAQAALTASANWLKQNAQYSLLIEGHCDERGTEQYNLALGDRRASAARDFLVTLGVDTGRIRTISYGLDRPFDPAHNEAAWAKNRRAHLVIVGK